MKSSILAIVTSVSIIAIHIIVSINVVIVVVFIIVMMMMIIIILIFIINCLILSTIVPVCAPPRTPPQFNIETQS